MNMPADWYTKTEDMIKGRIDDPATSPAELVDLLLALRLVRCSDNAIGGLIRGRLGRG